MIDASFIKSLEGFSNKGHVPDAKNSKSGVTIGIGVDIANASLDKFNLPPALYKKLVIYKGKRGTKARKFLMNHPLELTEEEALMISQIAMLRYSTFIKNFWNADSEVKWNSIPDFIQTVVFSVLYQYGRPARVPKFWKQATELNVRGMIEELRDFGDRYPTRRNKEADYLAKHIDQGDTSYA